MECFDPESGGFICEDDDAVLVTREREPTNEEKIARLARQIRPLVDILKVLDTITIPSEFHLDPGQGNLYYFRVVRYSTICVVGVVGLLPTEENVRIAEVDRNMPGWAVDSSFSESSTDSVSRQTASPVFSQATSRPDANFDQCARPSATTTDLAIDWDRMFAPVAGSTSPTKRPLDQEGLDSISYVPHSFCQIVSSINKTGTDGGCELTQRPRQNLRSQRLGKMMRTPSSHRRKKLTRNRLSLKCQRWWWGGRSTALTRSPTTSPAP